MSAAGSLCLQQQQPKGHQRLRATHNRVTFEGGRVKHIGAHFHLFLLLPMCRIHAYWRYHTLTNGRTPTSPHSSISHPFHFSFHFHSPIHLPLHGRGHWKVIMITEAVYYIRSMLCMFVTLDSTYGILVCIMHEPCCCSMVAIVTQGRATYLYFVFQRRRVAYRKSMSVMEAWMLIQQRWGIH